MGLSKKIRQQLINSFKTEQSEHIRKITEGLLALEKKTTGTERQAVLDEISARRTVSKEQHGRWA